MHEFVPTPVRSPAPVTHFCLLSCIVSRNPTIYLFYIIPTTPSFDAFCKMYGACRERTHVRRALAADIEGSSGVSPVVVQVFAAALPRSVGDDEELTRGGPRSANGSAGSVNQR